MALGQQARHRGFEFGEELGRAALVVGPGTGQDDDGVIGQGATHLGQRAGAIGITRCRDEGARIAQQRRAGADLDIAEAIARMLGQGLQHRDVVRGIRVAPQQHARRGIGRLAKHAAGIRQIARGKALVLAGPCETIGRPRLFLHRIQLLLIALRRPAQAETRAQHRQQGTSHQQAARQ